MAMTLYGAPLSPFVRHGDDACGDTVNGDIDGGGTLPAKTIRDVLQRRCLELEVPQEFRISQRELPSLDIADDTLAGHRLERFDRRYR